MNDIKYRKVRPDETDAVMALYSSLVGTPGCTWNEYYPCIDIVADDAERESLFCAEKNGVMIAAAACEDYDDLFELDIWQGERAFALSRVGVMRECQGNGVARGLLEYMFAGLCADFDSVRLLVSPENAAARKLYRSLGFNLQGEADLYDRHWLCMELLLNKIQ